MTSSPFSRNMGGKKVGGGVYYEKQLLGISANTPFKPQCEVLITHQLSILSMKYMVHEGLHMPHKEASPYIHYT